MGEYDDLPHFVIETNGGGGVGTFVLGALVGAAAALLLAPRTGAETQAEIAGAARRLREGVEGRVDGARERVSDRVERTRAGVRGGLDSVRDSIGSRVEQARAAIEAGREAAGDAREELQRRVHEAKATYRAGRSARGGETGNGRSAISADTSAEAGDDGADAALPAGRGALAASASADEVVIVRVEDEDAGDLAR